MIVNDTKNMAYTDRIAYAIDRIKLFDTPADSILSDSSLITNLIELGFFTAPASTRFHGAYEGGLFDHSMQVAERLVSLTVNNRLTWKRERSPLLIGLLHDICKADLYELSNKNEDHPYEYNSHTLYTGHGDKSLMMLCSIIKLTDEEAACIRYHMGAFTEKDQWEYYNRAIKNYPNVLWTHMADMLASKIDGV